MLTKCQWNRVLINTSGSGKTRLGLHGLCRNWGFYCVVKQGLDGIGSGDFWHLMQSLDYSFDYNRAQAAGSKDKEAAHHMEQKVKRRVLQFLLARFVLLNLLIEEATKSEEGLRPSDHRLLWVFLQALPTDMLKEDAFKELATALNISSINDLMLQIKDEHSKLKRFLGSDNSVTGEFIRRPLYCFLDEIQITTTVRMGEYRSEDADMENKERPLLRPIWHTMNDIFGQEEMLLILSGTALNETLIQEILSSAAFKYLNYVVKKDIGAFDDPDVQQQYIEYYLPGEQSEARQDFLKRAWGWCRGRYFQESYCQILILTTCSQVSQYSSPCRISTCNCTQLSSHNA